jgi:uncharacterized protein (DUF1330 family)
MPAYWIAHVTITDPTRYEGYQALAPLAFAAHGATFLARGGDSQVVEGAVFERHVIIQFPDMAAARACYASAEYTKARAARDGACHAHITLVDGLAG